MVASYTVQARKNSNLQLAGIIDDFATLDMLLRYNDVSEWVMTIDRRSLHVPNLMPVSSPLGINGNGIVVTRDYGAGPQVILSGPITHLDFSKSSQILTIKGYDDTIWLDWRNADTVPDFFSYSAAVLADSGLLRYYRLGESSGTTATDTSGHSNGTYNGGVTYSQAALIDGANTSVKFNGTTGYVVSSSSSGLPSGNAAFTLHGWCYLTANPGTEGVLCFHGTNTSNQGVYLAVQTGGKAACAVVGKSETLSLAAMALGISHMLAVTWDGTTLSLYVDGQLQGTQTPGALSLTLGNFYVGSIAGAANFANFTGDECALESGALSAERIMALYQIGRSHLAYLDHDNRSGQASTVMIDYVNRNAGPGTLTKRQVAHLTMAADPAIGGQVTGAVREDVLLDVLKNLALQSGDNIGFYIRQTLAAGTNTLAFTTYAPADKTSSAIFSDEIGNLQDYSFSLDWPVANALVIGGSGQDIDRNFVEVSDAASVSTYGRIEGFYNATQSGDYQTMVNAGNAQLLQTAAQTNFSFTGIDTAGLQYQRDYGPGDKVTGYIEGQTVQDRVREIHISLTKGGGQDSPDEVITPAIGQPYVAMAVPKMFSNLSRLLRQQQRSRARVEQLERHQ